MFGGYEVIRWIWIFWYVYWWILAAQGGQGTIQKESFFSMLRHRVLLFAGYVFLLWPWKFGWMGISFEKQDFWEMLGLGVCLCGLAFSVWARMILGAQWSGSVTVKQNHQLIVTGPYVLTRHPIYTGILTAAIGTVLNEGRLGSLLGFVLIFMGFYFKMKTEEYLMNSHFGSQYQIYMRKVKKIIPFIY